MPPAGVEFPVTPCGCAEPHVRRRVVLTGGPGAGKTAVLELIRRSLCEHVKILPESAGIVFGGGFPRNDSVGARRAAQRAIFHVQRELEAFGDLGSPAIVLCDRGTIDGLAYWPGPEDMWSSVGTDLESELLRYQTVIHLRTPDVTDYNNDNPLRRESASEARRIDERIARAWERHPHRSVVDATESFLTKAGRALELLGAELPACCRGQLPSTVGREPRALATIG